jgi:tetratricopeptide (TPR) repeat protein
MALSPDELIQRGLTARRENRPADAHRDFSQAVEICRKINDELTLAKALAGLGQIERDLQHHGVACRYYEESTAIYRTHGDVLKLAHTVRHLGDIYRHEKRKEEAEHCYDEALNLYRHHDLTPPLDLANAIRGLAILKDDAGENEEARSLWQEARDLYAAVNVEAGVTESSRRLARLEQQAT